MFHSDFGGPTEANLQNSYFNFCNKKKALQIPPSLEIVTDRLFICQGMVSVLADKRAKYASYFTGKHSQGKARIFLNEKEGFDVFLVERRLKIDGESKYV